MVLVLDWVRLTRGGKLLLRGWDGMGIVAGMVVGCDKGSGVVGEGRVAAGAAVVVTRGLV